ncbi:glutamyl-tRNA reductase [Marinobacteraceae bacterium S3BR75-40.1]
MTILALGISHRTAPVEFRERVAFPPADLGHALAELQDRPGIREVAILSTCNRTELYAVVEDGSEEALMHWWAGHRALPVDQLQGCIYSFREEKAARHMMRVACGLDSLVLGEPQILGQLKDTYALAREYQTVGSQLSRLFEQTFSVAKRVRTHTAIGENPVSVAYAAVSMARHIFADMRETRALLIGAGRTNTLVARHLNEVGVNSIVVANRTLGRAEELAGEIGGQAMLLSGIPEQLPEVDIVIASTASPLPVLGKGAVERAVKRRKHRPMFMVDIAVPRDIEPEVASLDDVYLYTVDDLRQVIESNIRSREGAAQEAEHLIESGAADFMAQRRSLDAVEALKLFRGKAESLRDLELEKAVRSLQGGADPQAVVATLARSLTNKLLHEPTVRVRQAASEGRHEAADWLRELYCLQPTQASKSANAPVKDGKSKVTVLPQARRYNSGTE